MIIDSSALIAILFDEDDAAVYANAISKAETRRISVANYFEAAIVADAQSDMTDSRQIDTLFRRSEIVLEPVTIEQAHIARQAYLDFGKGRHSAGLNFGDCFAYALAKATGEPLLYKGKDFSKTDIASVL